MNQISVYITRFFQDVTLEADADGQHHYKDYLENAIERFLRSETKETAYSIYQVFFSIYGYTGNTSLSFMNLLEKMRSYEEHAAVLTKKQRDHFIHSINVFLLGLAVYQANATYRDLFETKWREEHDYAGKLPTAAEEFLFRWGIAALCHDIGYPVEIITNQINDFINFTNQLRPSDSRIYAHVEYDRFELVNTIPEEQRKRDFIESYYNSYDSCVYIDLLKPVDLLAHELHKTLGLDLNVIKEHLERYVSESGKTGRVDHGFFSAVILLKWYGYLIQMNGRSPEQLYYPVLDSASAILLHNYYNIALVRNTKRPNVFNLDPLEPSAHPIAYLLILCDELQEWNREPYGEMDKLSAAVSKATILMEADRISITYIVDQGTMPEEFVGKKVGTLNSLLNLRTLFPGGFDVSCEAIDALPPIDAEVPLLLLGKLEQLAIAIHDRYNRTTRRLHPEKEIDYPSFPDLPKEKKFYNLRSALELPEELGTVDCELRLLSEGEPSLRVAEFTPSEVETIARYEHDRWMRSRGEQGWVYGKSRDKAHQTNPYMVPYDQLDEEIKEYDRDPARNLPDLLAEIGLGIYRKAEDLSMQFDEEQIEQLARDIHTFYMERWEKDHPGQKMDDFDHLSRELQESNRRQARGIPNKLRHMDCVMLPLDTEDVGKPVTEFTFETVDFLAEIEHNEWTGEKLRNGWRYAPMRNEAEKENEFLIGYMQLSEQMKEYDRDTVRHLPVLLGRFGLGIFPKTAQPNTAAFV